MNNINKIDKVTLEYLINPDLFNKHIIKSKNIDIKEFENDKQFYRKRIVGLVKEMLKGNFENNNLKDNFNSYIESLIIYFKEIDRKDLLQEYYLDLSLNFSNTKEKLKTIPEDQDIDSYLFNKDKLETNTIEKYINVKKINNKKYYLPEKRDVNLKDPKLRKKGLVPKEKSNTDFNSVIVDVKQKFIENKLDKHLLHYTFAPKAPDIWKTPEGKNTWLSSLDIEKVLKQFEYEYKNFAFLGPSPIDFDTPKIHNTCVWEELCKFELSNFLKKNKNKIGIVFNTDPHTKGGAHWICLMIDISKEIIYFFVSVGDKPPKEIDTFVERVINQGKSLGINFKYLSNHPFEHQMGNTECGIYVIYFLTEILQGTKNYEYFNSVTIPDKEMEKYREIYFN